MDRETLSLRTNPKFIKIIEKSLKSQKQEGRTFLEDIHSVDNFADTKIFME